jgi:hypothetical protein
MILNLHEWKQGVNKAIRALLLKVPFGRRAEEAPCESTGFFTFCG